MDGNLMDRNLSDRIRERAYEIWMATGCRDGLAEQHWYTAEQEILAGSSLDSKIASAPLGGAPAKPDKRRATAKRSKEVRAN
jgi:hypothetical protein